MAFYDTWKLYNLKSSVTVNKVLLKHVSHPFSYTLAILLLRSGVVVKVLLAHEAYNM